MLNTHDTAICGDQISLNITESDLADHTTVFCIWKSIRFFLQLQLFILAILWRKDRKICRRGSGLFQREHTNETESNSKKANWHWLMLKVGRHFAFCFLPPSVKFTTVNNCLWTLTDVNNMVTLVAKTCYAGHHVVYFSHLISRLHTWGVLNTESLWTAIH